MQLTRVSKRFRHEGVFLYGRDEVQKAFLKLQGFRRLSNSSNAVHHFTLSRQDIYYDTMRFYSLADELINNCGSSQSPVFLNSYSASKLLPKDHQLSFEQTNKESDRFLLKIIGLDGDIHETNLAKQLEKGRKRALSGAEISIATLKSDDNIYSFDCDWLMEQTSPFVKSKKFSGKKLAQELSANPIEGYRLGKLISTSFVLSLAISKGTAISSVSANGPDLIIDSDSQAESPSLSFNIELDGPRKNIHDSDLADQLVGLAQKIEDKFKRFVK